MTLASSAPVTTAMTPGDFFAAAASMILILRVRVRRAHEGHMRHARQHHVADVLRAALRQPRQIRPRHRAADVGVRPVERGEEGRGVVDDFHCLPPARACATDFDGIDDGVVAGAAAVVAGNLLADFLAARHAAAAQQFLRGQQHAGRTEAALQGVALLERRLAGRRSRRCPTRPRWSRPWRRRIAPPASGSRARSRRRRAPCRRRRRRARSRHGCRSAPDRRAGNRPGSSAHRRLGDGLAVHRQRDVAAMRAHGRASMSCLATRRSSTPARCFLVAPVACTSSDGSRSEASAFTASSMLPLGQRGLGLLGAQRRRRRRRNRRAARRPGPCRRPCALAASPTMA